MVSSNPSRTYSHRVSYKNKHTERRSTVLSGLQCEFNIVVDAVQVVQEMFSGSRDHTAKAAGGLLIAWSSTFFSNPPHGSPLSAEKVENCNTIITASLCS